MNRPLAIALLVAAVATWTVETLNRERMVKRIEVMRQSTRGLARARAYHEELLRRQPFAGEIESLRRDRSELAALKRELVRREQSGMSGDAALAALGREILPMGIWLPTVGMKDLGRPTPHAALQTFFWAVGAESLHALQDVLAVEPEGSERAEKVVATLLDAAGLRHSPPEALIAKSLLNRAPAGEIQFIAEQLEGFDQAVEYVAWKPSGGSPRVLCLRLRWEPGGWRVVLPTLAVENAGREIAGLPVIPGLDPFRDAPRAPEPAQ